MSSRATLRRTVKGDLVLYVEKRRVEIGLVRYQTWLASSFVGGVANVMLPVAMCVRVHEEIGGPTGWMLGGTLSVVAYLIIFAVLISASEWTFENLATDVRALQLENPHPIDYVIILHQLEERGRLRIVLDLCQWLGLAGACAQLGLMALHAAWAPLCVFIWLPALAAEGYLRPFYHQPFHGVRERQTSGNAGSPGPSSAA